MYFLINSDNSVNFASEEPIPAFMNHSGTWEIELPVDHLPENTDLQECEYDLASNSIIPGSWTKLDEQSLRELINQQKLIETSIKQQETEKFNKLVSALITLFPDNVQIAEILSDSVVTQDELQQIEDMLNNQG